MKPVNGSSAWDEHKGKVLDSLWKKQLLHTPEGVRDIYNEECEKKLLLQSDLLGILKGYGYHPIQTPTFEIF